MSTFYPHDHTRDYPDGWHAMFSGSKHSWANWSPEDVKDKVIARVSSEDARTIGTIIHAEAATNIRNKTIIPRKDVAEFLITRAILLGGIPRKEFDPKVYVNNFYHYCNDAIKLGMSAEFKIKPFSDSLYFGGTADALKFEDGKLIIFDLKTGSNNVSMEQLLIYAAFFCLEYGIRPGDIQTTLKIYQENKKQTMNPSTPQLVKLMDLTVTINDYISEWRR